MDVIEQKCPSCTAAMRYDPERKKLVCDYCGTVLDVKEASEPQEQDDGVLLEGFDFSRFREQQMDRNAENLPIYLCVSCGAEIIAAPQQFALTCPYCGNNVVLTDKISGQLRPNGVLPFKIPSDRLPDVMNRYYKDKKLLPRRFFSERTMGKITGVYLPFWVFQGRAFGRLSYRGEITTTHREGNYRVTETAHYRLVRDVDVAFEHLPVDASSRMNDAMMDALEPFDLSEAKDFNMDYLQGYTADRFDVAKDDISARAEKRMQNTAAGEAARQAGAGYSHVTRAGGTLRTEVRADYLLLPAYLFDLEFRGKTYSFAVNGQTGKVVGSLPIDKRVSLLFFLKRVGVVAAALIASAFVKFMLGG